MPTNNFIAADGEWNTPENWSLGHVPTSAEDCTFTGCSDSGMVMITITDTDAHCKSADFSTIPVAGYYFRGFYPRTLNVYGSVTFKSDLYINLGRLYVGKDSSGSITSNGCDLTAITAIYVTGGTFTMTEDLTTQDLLVGLGGTLVTNNYTLTIDDFGNNAENVTLTLGSSIINCLNVAFNSATLTVTANTATFNLPSGISSSIDIALTGGIVKLASAPSTTGTVTLTSGTLDLNGKTVTAGIFSSSNSNTRSLIDSAGGGKIVVNGLTGTIFNMGTPTNLTVSNTPAIDIGDSNNTLSGNVTFAGGGKAFGNFKVTKHAGNFTCDITGANTFGTFTQETPDATYQYAGVRFTADTQTNVTSVVADGTSSYQITRSSITAATHTINDTSGTNTVTYNTITNEIATGGATFVADLAAGNINGGGGSGWFPAVGPATLKTWNGVAKAAIAKINGVAIAGIKTWNGVA